MTKTILVVDDDADIRELLNTSLRKSGYDVLLATDGTEALQKLKKMKVDLVILDLMMPYSSGIEVMRKLGGKQKVVIHSVLRQTEIQEQFPNLGEVAYVQKPVKISELRALVKKILK